MAYLHLILLQLYLQVLTKQYIKTNIKDILETILEASCKSLIYPNDNNHIRAIVTIADNRRKVRYTKYTYNAESDPERVAEFPLEFGITGQAYISKSDGQEGEGMEEQSRQTYLKTAYPNMLSGHLQGKILEMISKMIQPGRVLEIGTFTGYSAICIAKGLTEDGLLQSIDSNDELKEMALKYIKQSGLEQKIELITGDALKILVQLSGPYDLIFIDADKKEYEQYYLASLDLLRSGGFMLVDNVLWGGKVLKENQKKDRDTMGIQTFNETVLNDNRVEQVILPVRDGLTLIRKK